jgi:hypothetical protein
MSALVLSSVMGRAFGHYVTVSKVSGKVHKAVENLLEETVAVPMKQRYQANVIRPMYPVWIVDYGNKVEKNFTEDRLRSVVGTVGCDDHVHVDAKTGQVHHGLHSMDTSNCGLPFGLVRIGEINDILRGSFYLTQELYFIPLWKNSRRFQ